MELRGPGVRRRIIPMTCRTRRDHPGALSSAKAPIETFEQHACFERLSEKAECTSRSRFLVQLHVGEPSDENHRRSDLLQLELTNEVEPSHTRHMNVGDDAVKAEPVSVTQQRFRPSKRFGAATD